MLLKVGDTVEKVNGEMFMASGGAYRLTIKSIVKAEGNDWADYVLLSNGLKYDPADLNVVAPAPSQPLKKAALRYNEGKPQHHWLDAWMPALNEIAKPFMYGAKKYGPYNYKKGAPYSENYNCARRHMIKWLNGEDFDTETLEATGEKVSHLAFAAWNIIRLLDESLEPGPGTVDDRPHTFLTGDDS